MVKCANCRALMDDYLTPFDHSCYFGEIADDNERECEFFSPKDSMELYLRDKGMMTSGLIKNS